MNQTELLTQISQAMKGDNPKERLAAIISNIMYDSAIIFELLEHMGLFAGNGHHAAQEIAMLAADKIKAQWRDKN